MSSERCPTCSEPYSKISEMTSRASVCSNGFHCCRDCTWEAGRRTTICDECALFEKEAEFDWYGGRQMDPTMFETIKRVCWRPAMYVGRDDFSAVCHLLQGYELGLNDWRGGFMRGILSESFQRFLAKRYRKGSATYSNIVWWEIINQVHHDKTDKEKIDLLLRDVEDFNNVLTRLAVETANMEDADD